MKWNKYTVNTLTSAIDIVSCSLMEIGVEGIEICDNVALSDEDKQSMFIDFLPELPPDDGKAQLNFYIDSDEDDGTLVEKAREELESLRDFCDIGEGTIVKSETEDKDWMNNWKQYFKAFSIDDIYIKPTWEESTDDMEGKTVVLIDPGAAFGTGAHETTQLVIRQLKKYLKKDDELLDVGCGSGILSIVGILLGAKHALGTDLDPIAIVSSRENAQTNNIPDEKIELLEGNIIDDKVIMDAVGYERYDVVAANILAEVLIPLSKVIAKHMKKGAVLITSGIIDDKEELVVKTFEENPEFEVLEVNHQGEWVNVTVRRI